MLPTQFRNRSPRFSLLENGDNLAASKTCSLHRIPPEFRLVENSIYEYTDFSEGLPLHLHSNHIAISGAAEFFSASKSMLIYARSLWLDLNRFFYHFLA